MVAPEDSEDELMDNMPEDIVSMITRNYDKALSEQKPIAEAFTFKNAPHIIYIDPLKN